MPAKKNDSKVETPIVPAVPTPVVPEKRIPRQQGQAAAVLGLGLVFGFLHSYFFYGESLGISYPLFMALALCGLWFLGEYQEKPMKKSELPWALGILFFSAMVAVRSDGLLTFLNVSVSFLGLATLVWLRTPVDGERGWRILRIVFLPFAFMPNWGEAFEDFRASFNKPAKEPAPADKGGLPKMRIVKGLLISLPLVFVYLVLFYSGDLVFRGALSGVVGWLSSFECPSFPDINLPRIILIAIVAVVFGGLFDAYVTKTRHSHLDATAPERARDFGTWESNIPLAVTNLVFLSFALLQLKYALGGYGPIGAEGFTYAEYALGGYGPIGAEGFTYAEYAKKGYWELSVAAVISFLVIFLIGRQALLENGSLNKYTRYLSVGLSVQVGFVIWCAFSRLAMYQVAYGLTMTRFYGYAFLIGLAGAFVFLSYKTWNNGSMRAFSGMMASWALAILAGLNMANPAGFVASENVGRPNDPEIVNSYPHRMSRGSIGVDYRYLYSLPLDAVPDTVASMDAKRLKRTYGEYRFKADSPWFTFHFSQWLAIRALDARMEQLGIKGQWTEREYD